MIGKFFSRVIKELTPADTSPVTLNVTGTYNPRYGKQKIYVSGRGGTAIATSGNPFDNSYTNAGVTTPGNPYNNSTYNSGNYNPSTAQSGTTSYVVTGGYWGETYNSTNKIVYHFTNWTASETFTATAPGFTPSNTYRGTTGWTYYSATDPQYGIGYQNAINTNASNYYTIPGVPWSIYVAGNTGVNASYYTPGNYVAGNTGVYATNYSVGPSLNILGITMPGGNTSTATYISPTITYSTPVYNTSPIPVTVPAGGYVTITFTL
jgi:hypothetical protein